MLIYFARLFDICKHTNFKHKVHGLSSQIRFRCAIFASLQVCYTCYAPLMANLTVIDLADPSPFDHNEYISRSKRYIPENLPYNVINACTTAGELPAAQKATIPSSNLSVNQNLIMWISMFTQFSLARKHKSNRQQRLSAGGTKIRVVNS